jgi:hypothetical protein
VRNESIPPQELPAESHTGGRSCISPCPPIAEGRFPPLPELAHEIARLAPGRASQVSLRAVEEIDPLSWAVPGANEEEKRS